MRNDKALEEWKTLMTRFDDQPVMMVERECKRCGRWFQVSIERDLVWPPVLTCSEDCEHPLKKVAEKKLRDFIASKKVFKHSQCDQYGCDVNYGLKPYWKNYNDSPSQVEWLCEKHHDERMAIREDEIAGRR